MDETLTAAAPAGGEPGPLARLVGVLVAPGKTFESIARKPAWVFPVVLLIIWSTIAGYVVTQKFDVDAMFQKQIAKMEEKGRTFSPEQLETQRKIMGTFVKLGFLFGTAWVTISLFFVPLVYHGLCSMLGKAGSYLALVSAYAYMYAIQIVKGILFLVVVLQKTTIDPQGIPSLLKSNLGAFLDPETSSAGLRAIASSIDVFDLWGLVVMVIALRKVRGLSQGMAAGIVFGAWLVWVLCSAGLATVGAAFGGG